MGSPAISLGLLPDVIKEFRDNFGDVTVSAQVRASQNVAEWVASGQVEIGFAAPPTNGRVDGLTDHANRPPVLVKFEFRLSVM